jgi:hypothetical protein
MELLGETAAAAGTAVLLVTRETALAESWAS